MIIMGNSVPPPSRRWTLVTCGYAYGPQIDSSQSRRPASRHARPPRIAAHRHAGRRDDLIVAHDHRDVVRPVLAVQLAGWNQRIRFPSAAIVDRHLGEPLREIPRSAAPPLASR